MPIRERVSRRAQSALALGRAPSAIKARLGARAHPAFICRRDDLWVAGVLHVGAVVVIVAVLLIFVRAVFRLVDQLIARDQ